MPCYRAVESGGVTQMKGVPNAGRRTGEERNRQRKEKIMLGLGVESDGALLITYCWQRRSKSRPYDT